MLSKPLGAGIMALGELDVVSKNQRGQKYLGHGVRDQFLSTQLATALTREPRIQSEIRDAGRKDEAAISSPKSMRSSAMGKVSRGVEFASGSATQSFVKKLGTDMGKKIADLMRKTALPKEGVPQDSLGRLNHILKLSIQEILPSMTRFSPLTEVPTLSDSPESITGISREEATLQRSTVTSPLSPKLPPGKPILEKGRLKSSEKPELPPRSAIRPLEPTSPRPLPKTPALKAGKLGFAKTPELPIRPSKIAKRRIKPMEPMSPRPAPKTAAIINQSLRF